MGYSSIGSGSKNSVSITPSYSSKDSVSFRSKDSATYTPVEISPYQGIKTTKKLVAAKNIKDILEMIERLEDLLAKKAMIDEEIVLIENGINEALGEIKGNPAFEKIKEYILKK